MCPVLSVYTAPPVKGRGLEEAERRYAEGTTFNRTFSSLNLKRTGIGAVNVAGAMTHSICESNLARCYRSLTESLLEGG